MQRVFNGLLAGLAATIVLFLLMVLKTKMGVMPDLNIINMIAVTMGGGTVLGWTYGKLLLNSTPRRRTCITVQDLADQLFPCLTMSSFRAAQTEF